MFDKIMLGIGAATSAAGIGLQGMAMGVSGIAANVASDAGKFAAQPHVFTLQLAAIICSAIGAGCLAISPSVRAGLQLKP